MGCEVQRPTGQQIKLAPVNTASFSEGSRQAVRRVTSLAIWNGDDIAGHRGLGAPLIESSRIATSRPYLWCESMRTDERDRSLRLSGPLAFRSRYTVDSDT